MAPSRIVLVAGPALLLVAALIPDLRPAVAILLFLGWVAVWRARGSGEAVGWAAAIPIAVGLTWPWIMGSDVPLGEIGCSDPLSAIAVRRVIVAIVVLAVVAGLSRAHSSTLAELGLRRPSVAESTIALAGLVLLAVAGLVVGPWIAGFFFGPLTFPVPPAALVPAVAFGIANATLEEVSYRGVLQAWLARSMPIYAAIVFQGLIFGIVHAGPQVLALLPLHVALLGAVGVAGGIVRWRTGSLAIPIGVHIGADIALYVGLACRAAA